MTLPAASMPSNSKQVNKVSFNAMGACKDIQYNKKHFYFFNMIKLKISETFIEMCFDTNFSDRVQKCDWIFLTQTMHLKM